MTILQQAGRVKGLLVDSLQVRFDRGNGVQNMLQIQPVIPLLHK